MDLCFNSKGDLQFTVDFLTFMESIPLEDVEQFISTLSCRDDVITSVTEQIFDGENRLGNSGWLGSDVLNPHTALEKARERVIAEADTLALNKIKRLVHSLESAKLEIQTLNNEIDKLTGRGWK